MVRYFPMVPVVGILLYRTLWYDHLSYLDIFEWITNPSIVSDRPSKAQTAYIFTHLFCQIKISLHCLGKKLLKTEPVKMKKNLYKYVIYFFKVRGLLTKNYMHSIMQICYFYNFCMFSKSICQNLVKFFIRFCGIPEDYSACRDCNFAAK